jgi:hypothetical protein
LKIFQSCKKHFVGIGVSRLASCTVVAVPALRLREGPQLLQGSNHDLKPSLPSPGSCTNSGERGKIRPRRFREQWACILVDRCCEMRCRELQEPKNGEARRSTGRPAVGAYIVFPAEVRQLTDRNPEPMPLACARQVCGRHAIELQPEVEPAGTVLSSGSGRCSLTNQDFWNQLESIL